MIQPRRTPRIAVILSLASIPFIACILSGSPAGGVTVIVVTAEKTESTGAGGAAPTSEAPSATVEMPPAETAAPTATFTISHMTTPPGASGTTRYITDIKTKDYAPQKKAIGGDDYNNNRYERPYTAETMEYLSDIDLTRVEMKIMSPWVYITFEFVEPRAAGIG